MRLSRTIHASLYLLCLSVLIATPAIALDSCPVPTGATYTIDEHSVCRRVTNGHASGQTIMVPTKTADEWSTGANAFVNATPAGITLGSCTASATKTFSTGGLHSCGIRSDGTIRCWGSNSYGNLGDGTTTDRLVQTPIGGGGTWKSISAGLSYSCGIRTDDTAWCWGNNIYGQLGDGTTTTQIVPTAVIGGGTWKSISAGTFASCGIKSDGTAYCWGRNANGQLGDGTTTDRLVPTAVSGGGTWILISTPPSVGFGDFDYSCGIKSNGAAYCWGYNYYGNLGDGTTTDRLVPTAVSGGGTWSTISAAASHTCGIMSDSTVRCWGDNTNGGLGDGTTTNRLVPTTLSGGGTWLKISAGYLFTCGLLSDSTARCWGRNYVGQLGDGTTTDRLVPTTLSGGGSWMDITTDAGLFSTACGIKSDLTARCWGKNYFGQLGDGTTTDRLVPTALSGGGTWTAGSGYGTSCSP